MVAASAVILSHAFVLTGGWGSLGAEPLVALFGISASEIAVNIFFFISGFLVSTSAINRKSISHFIVARALRIYPALIVVVFLSAFVLGPIITNLDWKAYFTTKAVYGYVGWNSILLFPLKMRSELPDVFVGLPYPSVVNGSLWTLPWELWMYICTGALAILGLLQRRFLCLLWLVLLSLHIIDLTGLINISDVPRIALRFGLYFSTGAVFVFLGDRIRLSPGIALGILILYAASSLILGGKLFLPLVLCYFTFFLALFPALVIARWSVGPDFSYGIYLYAYPVQQVLVLSGLPPDPYLHTLVALALTLPLAAMSWFFIEAPALRLRLRTH